MSPHRRFCDKKSFQSRDDRAIRTRQTMQVGAAARGKARRKRTPNYAHITSNHLTVTECVLCVETAHRKINKFLLNSDGAVLCKGATTK